MEIMRMLGRVFHADATEVPSTIANSQQNVRNSQEQPVTGSFKEFCDAEERPKVVLRNNACHEQETNSSDDLVASRQANALAVRGLRVGGAGEECEERGEDDRQDEVKVKEVEHDSRSEQGSSLQIPPPDASAEDPDWESADYKVTDALNSDDEVSALALTEDFIVAQHLVDPAIDVYDATDSSHPLLYRLQGHTFGGQCMVADPRNNILYSGSLDKTIRSWNLKEREGARLLETIWNHLDYVESVGLFAERWVASGGRGDKTIFVYETDEKGKLWRRHKFQGHEGWVTQLVFADEHTLISGSEDASLRLWELRRGCLLRVLPQDDSITCLSMYAPDVAIFGDKMGKLSLLDMETRETTHLLPNILVGTAKYSRSSKYHDKAVDSLYVTGNGYLVTASTGSKFVKVWKIQHAQDPSDHTKTEVTELQILREHASPLTTLCAHDASVVSAASDGRVLAHSFPRGKKHFVMAREEGKETDNTETTAFCDAFGGLRTVESPAERPTEVCSGPRLCRVGKTGLVRSSSSFQISFQLKPKVASVAGRMRLPKRLPAPVPEDEEWSSSSEEDAQVSIELSSSSADEDVETEEE